MKVFTSAAAAIIMMITCLVSAGYGATGETSLSGADMYAARCEACHGKIGETSIIRGATSTMMEFAIKSNFGGMKQLSGISSNDLQSISTAITSSELTAGASATHLIPSSRVYTSSGAAQAAEVQSAPLKSLSASAPVAPAMTTPAAVLSGGGSSLYGSKCGGCHGPAASSSKKGASASRIQAAIKGNAGGMGYLSSLSGSDLQAIADALGSGAAVAASASPSVAAAATPAMETATPEVSAPAASAPMQIAAAPDGTTLYSSNCAFCHGPMSVTAKRGATLARIQAAIGLNSGGMASLANMQATDLLAIAAALGNSMTVVQLPASSTTPAAAGGAGGTSLYDSSCAGCHGPLASSSKKGASLSRIQAAISGNVGGMASLSTLSATDLQTIASALGGGGSTPKPAKPAASKPATASKKKAKAATATPAAVAATAGLTSGGATLYDSSCAGCHGPLASSAKKGAAASAIQGAISAGTGGMGSLSSLSAADIQSIAAALTGSGGGAIGGAGGSGAPPGMTGNCLSCHPNGPPPGTMGGGKGGGKNNGGKSKGGESRGEGGGGEGRDGGDGGGDD